MRPRNLEGFLHYSYRFVENILGGYIQFVVYSFFLFPFNFLIPNIDCCKIFFFPFVFIIVIPIA